MFKKYYVKRNRWNEKCCNGVNFALLFHKSVQNEVILFPLYELRLPIARIRSNSSFEKAVIQCSFHQYSIGISTL